MHQRPPRTRLRTGARGPLPRRRKRLSLRPQQAGLSNPGRGGPKGVGSPEESRRGGACVVSGRKLTLVPCCIMASCCFISELPTHASIELLPWLLGRPSPAAPMPVNDSLKPPSSARAPPQPFARHLWRLAPRHRRRRRRATSRPTRFLVCFRPFGPVGGRVAQRVCLPVQPLSPGQPPASWPRPARRWMTKRGQPTTRRSHSQL